MAPTGIPCLTLKLAMDFLSLCNNRSLSRDDGTIFLSCALHELGVVLCFAKSHVYRYLLKLWNFHYIFVIELFHQSREYACFYKFLLILLSKSSPPFLVYYRACLLGYSDLLAVFNLISDSYQEHLLFYRSTLR